MSDHPERVQLLLEETGVWLNLGYLVLVLKVAVRLYRSISRSPCVCCSLGKGKAVTQQTKTTGSTSFKHRKLLFH